jgi:acetyl-CoA carboxylase carboxyl transferase subunit beta
MPNQSPKKNDRKPSVDSDQPLDIPPGLVETCKKCSERVDRKQLVENLWVCPKCDFHHRIPANEWIRILYDEDNYQIVDSHLYTVNPLNFFDSKDYNDRLDAARTKTGLDDACVNAFGKICDVPVVTSALDFFFMGGSMGSVVGEKVTRGAELALKEKAPFITISCSGGARMQEGMYSLMQLVKTSHACGKLREEGIPFISFLADPSTAGVMASFASLGDLIIAEEGALIGFAGPRVIAQTIGGELPDGFQRAKFCQDHGFVDIVVHRRDLRTIIGRLVKMFTESLNRKSKRSDS